MGSVNSLSGGLDVQGIVDNLIYAEREPIRRLERQSRAYQDRISAYREFNSKLLAMQTGIEGILFHGAGFPLNYPSGLGSRLGHSVFSLRKAVSSDESVLQATAAKGTLTGSFAIAVSQLAQAAAHASGNFASDTATLLKTGTLVIQKGSDEAVTITVDETNNTLQGLRNSINSLNAGFVASIVRDGRAEPYRLVITSSSTGTANSLSITSNLDQGDGAAIHFTETLAARDALLQVNGIDVVSSSNTVSDAIEGVTLNLRAASGSATVRLESDLDAIAAALKEFAGKYTDIIGYIASQSRYDAAKKQAGVLAGDFVLRQAQGTLSGVIMRSVSPGGSAMAGLWQIGFKLANDGSLSVDESKLREMLTSNLTGVAEMFLADAPDGGGGFISIGPDLRAQLKNLTDTYAGPVTSSRNAIQQNIDRIAQQISQMEDRLAARRELLLAQFARADAALRQAGALQASIAGQVSSLKNFR